MPTRINMPRLSDTMEEGVVAQWLKSVGDKVEEGDILAEIETDKATMEFESFHEGTLLHIGVQEGEGAPVDSLLAIIGEEGEDFSSLLNDDTTASTATEETTAVEAAATPAPAATSTTIPEGVYLVNMPRLSDTMTEGTVASWLKQVGDQVEEGDILAEIETDKATMEFESFNEGTLLHIGTQEGDSAPVDSLLAIIGPAGTEVAPLLAANAAGTVAEAPAEKNEASPAPVATTTVAETKATETPVANTVNGRILASPLAKKIAKDKGFNLADIKGSGENGRIIKKDVENFTPVAKTAAPAASNTTTAAPAAVTNFAIAGEERTEEVKTLRCVKPLLSH